MTDGQSGLTAPNDHNLRVARHSVTESTLGPAALTIGIPKDT
jgi:hypothetical protein